MDKSTVMKNYRFLALMLFAMVAGCVAGWFFPEFGHFIKPAGTVFINMMFCVVVPLVFASISNSVASVRSRKRAGKIMGTTVLTFVVTGAVAAVIMFIVMKLVPPVLEPWTDMATEAIGEHASLADMIVNFFTTDDFVGLLSRSAMLPLIVFSILFGFATNLVGGPDHVIGKFLDGLTEVMMAFVKIITYYAPHRLLRPVCGSGSHLRLQRGLRLWPGHGGVLSPVLYLHLHRLSPLRLYRRRQARHQDYVPAHRKARHHVAGHLLLLRHHPHQPA